MLVVASPKEFDDWVDIVGQWELKGCIFVVSSEKAHFGDPVKAARWFSYEMQRIGARYFILDTLFDYFGPEVRNANDQNRAVMAEQGPLLEVVRTCGYAGIVTGHQPKSEAQGDNQRDPAEAFAGHNAWSAQHRMRVSLRRKSQGFTAIIIERGGRGDAGIAEEQLLAHDKATHRVWLGGPFKHHLGEAAADAVIEQLELAEGWCTTSYLAQQLRRSTPFARAGAQHAVKQGKAKHNGKKGRASRFATLTVPDEAEPEHRPEKATRAHNPTRPPKQQEMKIAATRMQHCPKDGHKCPVSSQCDIEDTLIGCLKMQPRISE